MKYNYVIFASLDGYHAYMYGDLLKLGNVEFVDYNLNGSKFPDLYRKLYHLHNSKINWYVELPGKGIWNKLIYNKKTTEPERLCFVFFMSDLRRNKEPLFKYLKRKYSGCRMIMYFEDIVASRGPKEKNYLDFSLLDKYFDLAFSYDKGDCEKYGFLYYPTTYTVQEIPDNDTIQESDVFYCGMAKKRYDEILSYYVFFDNHKILSDFVVVANEGQIDKKTSGINYRSTYLPYEEYLQHVKKTNCIMELVQEGATGYTLRVWEALVYGKKLLTNNPAILEAPFYDPIQFRYSNVITEDDLAFVKQKVSILPRLIEEVSPVTFLNFIDQKL